MALVPRHPLPLRIKLGFSLRSRTYATVKPVTLVGKPPGPPESNIPPIVAAPAALDSLVLARLRTSSTSDLPTLLRQYDANEGHILGSHLPYESRPNMSRRVNFDRVDVLRENGVVMVAHAIRHQDRHKVALCSGFALNIPPSETTDFGSLHGEGQTVIVTCAHTLEEMRNSPLLLSLTSNPDTHSVTDVSSDTPRSGSFVLSGPPSRHTPIFHPVASVLSSLHRADLMLLGIAIPGTSKASEAANPQPKQAIPTLPILPYPVHPGTSIRAHFVIDKEPDELGWRPWAGGTWSKWVKGTVVGYRDFAGREAKPGTYDALSHLLFEPLPTPGSSGGPIIDEESGTVVGVVVGTRMDSEIHGVRGWGRPAETIYEMFSLPGLNLRKT